jgi:signal transduction histidine kinase
MSRLSLNRLWLQLSLAFATVIVLAAVVIGVLGFVLRRDSPAARPQPNQAAPAAIERRVVRVRTNGLLLLLVLSGLLGIGAGVWMSRRLTAPLDELAEGTQAIRSRDLSYRVAVRGTQEIRTLAHSFNDMAAALEKAETLRQNLLADVAHELRTPLTVLLGNLRAMLDDVYMLDKSEVARLYDQTRHLIGLVNDLHELALAEAHRLPLALQTVDLGDLVQDAAELLEPVAELQGVQLAVNLPATPLCVQADRARLMQVVQNLLANALRHTPQAGEIRLQVEAAGGGAMLMVADNGDGIDPRHLPYLFDRFYRADQARDRDHGGAGLGLAIVRAMVEAHGGRVTAISPGPGQGSCFTVHLPLAS